MFGPSVFPEKQVISKWLVLQHFQRRRLYQNGGSFSISRKGGYTKMVGPSVFPDTWVLKMLGPTVFPDSGVLNMAGPSVFPEKEVMSKWWVLQYFQKRRLYQNGWSFSISRKASYFMMAGPSVFPDTRVIPEWLDFQYFQIHKSLKWLDLQYFEFPTTLK